MSFTFPALLRRPLNSVLLQGLLLASVATAGLGVVGIMAYLAHQGMLSPGLGLLGFGPVGGAIALAWVTAHRLRLQIHRLQQQNRLCESNLRKNEQWLQQYSQLSPGNFYILVQEPDGQVRFEFMSSAIETIHEVSVEQVLQDASVILNAIHPEDLPTYSAAVQASAATLGTFSLQWRIITPSGQVKWVQGQSQPQRRPNGAIAWYGVVIEITDRKQAEADLQQTEKRHRAILDAIPDLIIRMGRDGTYLDIKPTDAFPMIISAADVGRNIVDLLPLEIARQRLNAAEKVLQSGQMQVFEFSLQVAEELLWEEVRIFPLNPEEVVIIIRDLSQRRQMEMALRESETRFRQLAETVKEGFFVFETETAQYSYLNPAILDLTGVPEEPSPDEPAYARGMSHWLNHIHPQDRPLVEAKLQEERDGEPFDVEYRFLHPDGRQLWLRSKAFPLKDETGKTVRIVGTVEEITDRKRLEQALQENEELFRRAFNDAPIGISLVSPAGRYLRVNKCYCDLLGYSQAEMLQMRFKDITHPEDVEADLWGFEQICRGETQTFQMEKRYIAKDGTVIPVWLNSSCVHDANGLPLYSIGHIQDIRDRLEVDRIKDEFISIVSHELRTPITSIEGSLQLLGSGIYNTRPEKAKDMLDIAIKNSNRLVRLVDDILSFERLESGKVELIMEPCQVKDLMHQAIDSVSPLADQAAITLQVSPCPAKLHAAPDAIVQTLTNLLGNAIKFSEPRQTVWVEAREWRGGVGEWASGRVDEWEGDQVSGAGSQVSGTQDEPSSSTQNPIPDTRYPKPIYPPTHPPIHPPTHPPSILFSVTDQGRGIPPEKLDRIFDQFQQVDVSDSRQKGGTGLGLAICKRIVQQHGGEIWVESRLGMGSRFYFTVPVGKERERGREKVN
jgi:PAS domain S-box-containing protein